MLNNEEKREDYQSIPEESAHRHENHEILYNQNNPANNIQSNIISHILTIIFSCIWYLLFLSFSTNPEHFGSEKECHELLRVTRNLSGFYYSLIIANLILAFLVWCAKSCIFVYLTALIVYFPYVIIWFIIYLISMINSLKLEEPCKDLHTLSLVWVIVSIAMLVLPCILCCCFLCCFKLGGMAFNAPR
jgi:hypothetical protein